MPVVVEIVARLGDTVLDHAHVAPGARYRLADRTFVAKPGTYQVGLVTVTMERTFRVEVPVPRRRIAWRPIVYAALSLAAHLALLLYALLTEPYERMTARTEFRPFLMTRIEEPVVPPKPAPRAKQDQPTGTGQRATKRQARKTRFETASPDQAIASLTSTMRKIGKDRLADIGPVYNEDDANSQEFGNHLWDIDNDPDFATVKTGEGYDIPSGSIDYAALYELKGEAKTRRKFEIQVALAHKSAARGDCFPAHRIAKWLEKLDKKLFASMYLADSAIVACLRQEVDPRVQWHGVIPTER